MKTYYAVTNEAGDVAVDNDQAVAYIEVRKAHMARGFYGVSSGHMITEVYIVPADKLDALVEKAHAVINRWDSRDWKATLPTAEFIYDLRDALAAFEGRD